MSRSTKDLARELGFIRKRSSTTQQRRARTAKTRQLFSHLVVLDFESTCWQDAKYRTQEVIEFPAVLLDTGTGKIESEFQYYVQPQENPILSDFCKQLTGITQDQVDDGIPLNICLSKFNHWLKRQSQDHRFVYNVSTDDGTPRCTFVTWSDWDLNVCLQYETRRKQLRKPAELNSWIDLRATYRKFYDRKPKGLNGALQDLGLNFEGREHSGLHDSRNTARLAYRMMCDGCVMNITKTIQGSEKVGHLSVKTHQNPVLATKDNNTHEIDNSGQIQAQSQRNETAKRKSSEKDKLSKIGSPKQQRSIGDCFSKDYSIPQSSVVGACVSSPPSKKNKIQSVLSFSVFQDKSPDLNKQNKVSACTGNQSQFTAIRDITNTTPRATDTLQLASKGTVKTNTTSQNKINSANRTSPTWMAQQHNVSSSKTPLLRSVSFPGPSGSCFRTPFPPSDITLTNTGNGMKRTPPMCTCGRRAKRKFAQKPGPNMGRAFFCCGISPAQKSVKKGCQFFKWEPSENEVQLGTSPILAPPKSNIDITRHIRPSSFTIGPGVSGAKLAQPDFSTPQTADRAQSCLKDVYIKKTLGVKMSSGVLIRPPNLLL